MRKVLAIVLLGAATWVAPSVCHADPIFAITTGGRLISFDSATPGTILSNVGVSGVAGSLVGIDFRPATPNVLVGLGNNAGVGTVYEINTATGAANAISSNFALDGTSFGVDFNPVPNALRIVSNTGQNLRITAGGTGTVFVDGPLNIGNVTQTNVVGAGYTNSFAGATTTTLYVLQDNATTADALYIQNPPNEGVLNLVSTLGINLSQLSGFDISRNNVAFLSWNGGNQFGTLNLTTGVATNLGAVGGGFAGQIVGIAATVPEPSSLAMVGAGLLACFAWRRGRIASRRAE